MTSSPAHLPIMAALMASASATAQIALQPQAEPRATGAAEASRCDDRQCGVTARKAGNHVAAAEAFRNAARQGDAEAMRYLGDMTFAGEGVAQNYEQAVAWYCRAALDGDHLAAEHLEIVGLASWSQRREAGGWEAACQEWLNPTPSPHVEALQPAEEGPGKVVIELQIAPTRDAYSSSLYWPWYGYPDIPWRWAPLHGRTWHPHELRYPPERPRVPGLPSARF